MGSQESYPNEGLSLHFQEIWPESRLNWSLQVSPGVSSLKPAKTHTVAFPGSPLSQLDRKPSAVQTSWQTSRRGLTGRWLPSAFRWSSGTTAGTGALNPWAQQWPHSQASSSALMGSGRPPTAPGWPHAPPTAVAWPHPAPPLLAEGQLLFPWFPPEARPWAPIGHRTSPESITVARGERTHRLARARSCDHTLQDTFELLSLCQRWRQCDTPRAGLRVQSLCPCAQCPGTCLRILSTHHFVLCTHNIHDTPLPFPSAVSRAHIQGSRSSCWKIGLEILS